MPPSSTTTATVPDTTTLIAGAVVGGHFDGPERWEVPRGNTVRIELTSDVADEVHVHGYDVLADLSPGGTLVIEFVADIPGIFEVELEGAGSVLLELVVS